MGGETEDALVARLAFAQAREEGTKLFENLVKEGVSLEAKTRKLALGKADEAAVLVVTSGDKRVDEKKVAAQVGSLGRADADFVKARTGFTIGGVSPLAHATPAVTLIDRELFRFDVIWAAAGHPNGVFRLSPQQLQLLTGAPVMA